jgi:hypothetical protein
MSGGTDCWIVLVEYPGYYCRKKSVNVFECMRLMQKRSCNRCQSVWKVLFLRSNFPGTGKAHSDELRERVCEIAVQWFYFGCKCQAQYLQGDMLFLLSTIFAPALIRLFSRLLWNPSLEKHDVVDASTNCETGICFIFFLFFGLHSCGACYRACLSLMSSSLLRWNRLRLLNLLSRQSLQIDRACKLDMNLAEMKQVQKFANASELQRTASRALSTQFGGCFFMSFFMS